MTGLWPRVPRSFWHVGPMARSVRDIALAYSLLVGPDGADGFSTSLLPFDTGIGASPDRPLRVGWLVEPGFGPIDTEVAATVQAAAEALQGAGCLVEPVRIPALERDDALDVFNRLHVMELKPAFVETTAGHENEMFKISKSMLATPDTTMTDFVLAEQATERLRDGFAEYFQRYDALLCPVLPIPAHAHGLSEIVINGQSVPAMQIQGPTVPFNVTGFPGLSIRFGTSRDGLPIGVQLVSNWFAESTVLHLASLLETASPVRDLHPAIQGE
jgi:aspartyl-tRNA(Asn)/glutamyl-tRNA(Gln) amidotransferase subunit A